MCSLYFTDREEHVQVNWRGLKRLITEFVRHCKSEQGSLSLFCKIKDSQVLLNNFLIFYRIKYSHVIQNKKKHGLCFSRIKVSLLCRINVSLILQNKRISGIQHLKLSEKHNKSLLCRIKDSCGLFLK